MNPTAAQTSARTTRSNSQPAPSRPVITDSGGEVQNVGLDQMLGEAATTGNRFIPGVEVLKAASNLARRPGKLVGHTATVAGELAQVVTGRSDKAAPKGDNRFRDPAWRESWLFRRVMQSYLSVGDYAHALLDDAELDWGSDARLRLVVDNLIDALAPTNFPLTNPAVWKATVDKGGRNFVTGGRAAIRDARSPAKLPASVDPTPFKVGETMAASPGAVVRREAQYEVLQYEPRTTEVHEVPILLVPPMISKFYVVDLSPGKSMVEFLGDHGMQVFALSWKNPTKAEADWSLPEYIASLVEAFNTVREVAGSKTAHIVGFCAGGMAVTTAVAHLAAIGEIDNVASLNLMVTVLDMEKGGPVLSFASKDAAKAAVAKVRRKGYLAGTELARTFAWLRPNDMIWNNFVNNYYLGNKPPAFDLLFWNLDSMNMPAGLHRDMIQLGLDNPLAKPGGLTMLGTPLDLKQITCDAYVVGGETDHLTPWPNCYRSVRMFGGTTRYVLSTSGHIAAVIHPPGNPKSTYRIGDESHEKPEDWLASAELRKGTWWEHWGPWLTERSGASKPAPKKLGTTKNKPMERAPGTYVFGGSRG